MMYRKSQIFFTKLAQNLSSFQNLMQISIKQHEIQIFTSVIFSCTLLSLEVMTKKCEKKNSLN